MSWSEWLISIALILNVLLTIRRFSFSSPASGTDILRADQERDAVMYMNVRLTGENQQWVRKYEQLEDDHRNLLAKLQETEQRLERRTQALRACRELLTQKQGIEDSGEMLP